MSDIKTNLIGLDAASLANVIEETQKRINIIVRKRDDFGRDPIGTLIKLKKEQLSSILDKYGQINLRTEEYNRIPMILSRIQGEESIVRAELCELEGSKEKEKELQKRLEIARGVLAEKNKPGGRAR